MTHLRTKLLIASVATLAATSGHAQSANEAFDCVIKPREIVQLGSATEGVLIARDVERGAIVKAGQVVARLEDTSQKLAVGLAKLSAERDVEISSRKAAAAFREAELARISDLASRNLTPQIEAERAALELELARFAVEAAVKDRAVAKVELDLTEAALDRRTIKSSVEGVVIETNAAPGDYVTAQTTILTLAKLDVLNVEVFLPTALFGLPVEGATATVTPEDPIGGAYEATIETVDRVFDAASGTFGVRLTLENDGYALPAGLRCRVSFAPG